MHKNKGSQLFKTILGSNRRSYYAEITPGS